MRNSKPCYCERSEAIHIMQYNGLPRRSSLSAFTHRNDMNRKAAFTLAEVLTTLTVIGVVAALTIPSLNNEVNSRTLATRQKVFDNRLNEGLRRMKAEDKLEKTYTTSEFVDEMGKYFNISQVCEPENLTDCFGEKIISYEAKPEGEEFEVSELTNTNNFNDSEESNAPVKGVKFSDGTTMIMGYKPDCVAASAYDDSSDQSSGKLTSCMRYIADVDPKKKTKKYGGSTAASQLHGDTKAEQQENKTSINKGNSLIGNISLTKGNAYGLSFKIVDIATYKTWDEAVAYCQAQGASLSNAAQLTEMADKIYLVDGANCTKDTNNGQPEYYNCNTSIIEAQPLKQYLGAGGAYVWSSVPSGANFAYSRYFYPGNTGYRRNYRINLYTAVCVR